MKTCLKRSEIIAHCKRFIGAKSVDIYRISDIQISHFNRYYVCILQFPSDPKRNFQLVYVHLCFGWINFVINRESDSLQLIQSDYLETIHSLMFDEINKHDGYEG